jgi:nucleotide-binding universal stress UspA family protein
MYDRILVALDGSQSSRYAGETALALAAAAAGSVIACHIYGVDIHRRRFTDMEPGLPDRYQEDETLTGLRSAHDRLIHEGFRALSAGYVEDFVASCRQAGIAVSSLATEGRSYTGILQIAKARRCNLICLGADGLGAIGDGILGGTTTRVLHNAPCDVLVARRAPDKGPVLTGVDGSDEALRAVAKAVALGRAMERSVRLIAAYDPDFHTHVFSAVGKSLSPERQQQVGLAGQERLHDDIINDGLGKLYSDFLREAERRFNGDQVTMTTSLVTGKAYRALDSEASDCGADLIVVSRHGNHREPSSRLGSNAEGLLRTTSTNVLLVGGVGDKPADSKPMSRVEDIARPAPDLTWDCDAETRLERVPSFVRNMAKRAVENSVRELGRKRVSVDDFDGVAAQFGMGKREADV